MLTRLVPSEAALLVDGHLLLVSHCIPSVSLYVCVPVTSSYKDTSHIGLGATLIT